MALTSLHEDQTLECRRTDDSINLLHRVAKVMIETRMVLYE